MPTEKCPPSSSSAGSTISDNSQLLYYSWLQPAQILLILTYLSLFMLALFFTTIESDEAWILLSTFKSFGVHTPNSSVIANPTLTSGGLHFLIHGLLGLISENIYLHRAVSFCMTIGILALTLRITKGCGLDRVDSLAVCLLLLASSGFLFNSSLAMAEVIATILLLISFWILSNVQYPNIKSSVICGIIVGLSCATRINCVLALPIIVLYTLNSGLSLRLRFFHSVLMVVTAVLVLAGFLSFYVWLFGIGNSHQISAYLGQATGLQPEASYGSLLRQFIKKLLVGNNYIPYLFLFSISTLYVIQIRRRYQCVYFKFGLLLLGFSLINIAFWLVKSPISHVRYLYPGIPFFWLSAGLIALPNIRRWSDRFSVVACHIVIILFSGTMLLSSSWYLLNGDSLSNVLQIAQEAPLVTRGKLFQASRDQRILADIVKSLPTDAGIMSFSPDWALPITYLSWRVIGSIKTEWPAFGPKYIVFVPAQISTWPISDADASWLSQSASKVFDSSGFTLYKVHDGAERPGAKP